MEAEVKRTCILSEYSHYLSDKYNFFSFVSRNNFTIISQVLLAGNVFYAARFHHKTNFIVRYVCYILYWIIIRNCTNHLFYVNG
jgi:hypothetical protein